jgi:Flp pilus assembly protein TadG
MSTSADLNATKSLTANRSRSQDASTPSVPSFWHHLRRHVHGFVHNVRGNVVVIFAVVLVPALGAAGLATDSALAFMVKSRMVKALDAGGLAAGRVIFSGDVTADAEQFFQANFQPGYLDATLKSFDVQTDENNEFITLTATATMPTQFMRLFGHDTITVSARSVVRRSNRGAELVLVMDNTGSMRSGGKMGVMKQAAQDLVDIVYGDEETHDNLWVSLVPYTATVNIGPQRENWLDPSDRYFTVPSPFEPTTWKGCVEARAAPRDQDDTPPNVAPFTSFLYEADVDNIWPPIDDSNGAQNNGTGPNLGCGPPILPLVAEKSTVKAAIANMLPWHRGGTTGNLGLVWGWRVISPSWRGLWGGSTPAELPLDYGQSDMDKVVVILTDGQNQFYDWKGHPENGGKGPRGSDYTAHGRLHDFGYATLGQARQEIDRRFAGMCQTMKGLGIRIYTVTFGPSPDANTQTLYRNCATDPSKYFHSPDNATLGEAFQVIGEELSNLRIAE